MTEEKKARIRKILEPIFKTFDKEVLEAAKKKDKESGGKGSLLNVLITDLNKRTEEIKNTITYDDINNFAKEHKLTKEEFSNVINNIPETNKERKAQVDYRKLIRGKKFAPISKFKKDVKLRKEYEDASNLSNTTTAKTTEQQEANKAAIESLLNTPAYTNQQVINTRIPSGPLDPSTVIRKQFSNLGKEGMARALYSMARDKNKEINAAKTLVEKQKINQKYAEQANRLKTIYPEIQNLISTATQTYQRGAPPVKKFGKPTSSDLLTAYDKVVNALTPERTRAQRFMAASAPYSTQAGASLGSILGTLGGGPLGGAVGGSVGSLLGLGTGGLLEQYSQPQSRVQTMLNQLGKKISGTPAGYFRGGTRGLAGIISGTEDPRSTWQNLFGSAPSTPPPSGRIGALRSALGRRVQQGGEFLSQPNSAEGIRSGIETLQALYGLTGELGINEFVGNQIGRLGRKIGVFGPEVNMSEIPNISNQIAASAIPTALQFGVPELQRQAAEFFGRPVPVQDVTQGLDQQIMAALAPNMAQQNIQSSRIIGKKEALRMKKAALKVDRQTQAALNKLNAQQKVSQFQQATQRQDLMNREMIARAKMNAQRNRISAAEVLSGQNMRVLPPIERIQPQPGIPEALNVLASQVQQNINPILQSKISQSLIA